MSWYYLTGSLVVVGILAAIKAILPLLLYYRAVKAYGKDGVIFYYKPFQNFLTYIKESNQLYKRSFGQVVKELQTKPDAKVAIIAILNFHLYILLDPESIRQATNEHVKKLIKSKGLLFVQEFERGLIFSEGEIWKRSRTILSDLFRFEVIKNRQPIFQRIVHKLTEDLEAQGSDLDLRELGLRIGGESVLRSLFGDEFADIRFGDKDCLDEIQDLINAMINSTRQPVNVIRRLLYGRVSGNSLLLTPQEKNHYERIKRFKTKCNQFLSNQAARYKQGGKVAPFVEAYLKHNDPSIVSQIIDQVVVFLIAGQDTTGLLIETSLYALAQHSKYQDILYEQVKNVQIADLHKCQQLNNFINECARLVGPVRHSLLRSPAEPVNFGGLELPAQTKLIIGFGFPMLNPKYFDQPLEFRPERFSKAMENPFAFMPFSGGPRNCIGQYMSTIEIRIALTEILKKYRLSRTETPFSMITRGFTSEPLQHKLVKFTRRNP